MASFPARLVASLFVSLAVTLVSVVWVADVIAEDKATPRGPLIPRAEGDQCVADTDLMRREHMDLMNHQRDETVIDGVRGDPYSIAGCVDCHAQKDDSGNAIRVDAEGQFCQSCHTYAAVKIDCFSCHAAVPTPREDAHKKSAGRSGQVPWHNLFTSLTLRGQTHGQYGPVANKP